MESFLFVLLLLLLNSILILTGMEYQNITTIVFNKHIDMIWT